MAISLVARRPAFGEDAVALRVGVGAETKVDFAGVVHVHTVVYHKLAPYIDSSGWRFTKSMR